jgi:hypothetical protein
MGLASLPNAGRNRVTESAGWPAQARKQKTEFGDRRFDLRSTRCLALSSLGLEPMFFVFNGE